MNVEVSGPRWYVFSAGVVAGVIATFAVMSYFVTENYVKKEDVIFF